MTTPPKRLTAEEEAREIVEHWWWNGKDQHAPLKDAIAAALRKRDELYAKAWDECVASRLATSPAQAYAEELENTRFTMAVDHDAARKERGLE